MQTVLPFQTLPKGLPFSKKVIYCLLDISGIQSYIFHAMDRHTTAGQVRSRSAYVESLGPRLQAILEKQFPGKLLSASPVGGNLRCLFHPSVDPAVLQTFLEKLQRAVFASTEGKLTFFFAFCQAKCIPEDRFCREKMCLAGAYLAQKLEAEKYQPRNLLKTHMQQERVPLLTPPDQQADDEPPQTDQAAVKLDLDNLGTVFQKITAYDRHRQVSHSLNRHIKACLEADARISPVFAGGDDIFFLCPLAEFLPVVADFYRRLRLTLAKDPTLARYAQENFGLSAGISVILKNNRMSMSAYWEESEQALHLAKTEGQKNCVYLQLPAIHLHIAWEDLTFLAEVYSRPQVRAQLFEQHRFKGANLANLAELIQQLQQTGLLTKKEMRRLDAIKSAL